MWLEEPQVEDICRSVVSGETPPGQKTQNYGRDSNPLFKLENLNDLKGGPVGGDIFALQGESDGREQTARRRIRRMRDYGTGEGAIVPENSIRHGFAR
jgi:hypothetical protein